MGFLDHYSAGSPPAHHRDHAPDQEGGSPAPELEAVLESECVALLALEATRARIRFLPGDHDRAEADIGGAIELLRRAIADLRPRFGGSPPSLLALGFVARNEDLGRARLPRTDR
jgi:hypothetical protein